MGRKISTKRAKWWHASGSPKHESNSLQQLGRTKNCASQYVNDLSREMNTMYELYQHRSQANPSTSTIYTTSVLELSR